MAKRNILSNLTAEKLAPVWARHDIPIERIAQALGVTRQNISLKAHTLGLPSRARVRRKFGSDDLFTRMWQAGVCTTDMAEHFGYAHRSCVSKRRASLGLPARRQKRGAKGRSGWIGTITINEYWEMEIGRKMQATP